MTLFYQLAGAQKRMGGGLGGGFKARLTFGPSNLYGDTLRRPLVSTDGHKFETLHNMANQAEEAEAVLFVHKTLLKGSEGTLWILVFCVLQGAHLSGKSHH